MTDESVKDVDLYVATGRDKHSGAVAVETIGDPPPPDASPKEAMRHKLRTGDGRAVYKMRKAIVKPVFGQIKEQRGFRRYSLCGKPRQVRLWKPLMKRVRKHQRLVDRVTIEVLAHRAKLKQNLLSTLSAPLTIYARRPP